MAGKGCGGQPRGVLTPRTRSLDLVPGVLSGRFGSEHGDGGVGDSLSLCVPQPQFPHPPLLQQGARVFGALGPIGPSSPGLTLGGLAVGEHRLSNKLLAWSGVLEWQEVSSVRSPCQSLWGCPAGGVRPGRLGCVQ